MTEPNWSELSHFLGKADDLPPILKRLTPDPASPLWDELWDRVYHQGNTFSASAYVLPRLLETASTWKGVGRVMPLTLAGEIVASPEFNAAGWEETLARLHAVSCETAVARDLSRSDRIYVMGSALALSEESLWGREFPALHDEEFFGVCPSCSGELYLSIGTDGCFVANEDPVNANGGRAEIVPCEIASLGGFRAWLHRTAVDAEDTVLAKRILCVFGTSTCPICLTGLDVGKAIDQS